MSIGVAIFHDDASLTEEVVDAIDRAEGIHLVSVNQARDGIDVILAGGNAIRGALRHRSPLVVLSNGADVEDARAGFEAGARGWLRWPHDASDLTRVVARAGTSVADDAEPPGRLLIVAGARGGAGTSTVVALLAAGRPESLIVDPRGDQLAFAPEGSGPGGYTRALASPVAEVVQRAAQPHAAGRALYGDATEHERGARAAVIDAARRVAPLVVVDAGPLGAEEPPAGDLVVVLRDDVESLRRARASIDRGARASFVLNRMRRRSVRASHVERALGVAPVAVLGPDRRLARAADLGTIPIRIARAFADEVLA